MRGGGGKAPRSPYWCLGSVSLLGVATLFYLLFLSRMISAASSTVLALLSISCASISKNSSNSWFVISSIFSSPFKRGFPLPYNYIIAYLHKYAN